MNIRYLEVGRAAWGMALLIAPRQVLQRLHHVRVDQRSEWVARVLGARHLTQAAISGVEPTPAVLAVGVWVDVVHAATAVGLAAVDDGRRRAGLTDTAVAATWAALGLRDLLTSSPGTPATRSRRDALAQWALRWLPGAQPLRRRTVAPGPSTD